MRKFLFSWDTIGIIFTTLGATVLAGTLSPWVFVIYFIGNLSWVIYWWGKKEYKTMAMCGFFMMMNVWGMFKWLI